MTVISVFIHLIEAFDFVPTNILLAKFQFQAYGIRGDYIKWFQSYLTDRTQYVNFNGEEFAEHTLKCGVPQGSILGPIFFIIFVNDMFNVSNVLFNVLYADDTCIYISGSDINALFGVLNIEFAAQLEWLNANRLTLNVDKILYMLFHRKHIKSGNLKLTIGQGSQCEYLGQISQCKYLGLIIDNKLNWAADIAHIKSKISKSVGVLTLSNPQLFSNILDFFLRGFCLIRVPKRQKKMFSKIQPIIIVFLHCAKFRTTDSRVINYYDYKYFSHVVLLLNT